MIHSLAINPGEKIWIDERKDIGHVVGANEKYVFVETDSACLYCLRSDVDEERLGGMYRVATTKTMQNPRLLRRIFGRGPVSELFASSGIVLTDDASVTLVDANATGLHHLSY